MKKYVYKIENKINGKIYIGQTNNLKRRFNEHVNDKRKNTILYKAIHKYGKENFKMSVLYFGSEYNEQEKYWISFYHSQEKDKGYNIVGGGQDSSGEDNPMSKITEAHAESIKRLLRTTHYPISEISEIMNVPESCVRHINYGDAWRDGNASYPIRPKKMLDDDMIIKIISDLKNLNMSITDIAKKYHVRCNTIKQINYGNHYKMIDQKYPIRSERFLFSNQVAAVKYLLKNTGMCIDRISDITRVSKDNVYRINNGTTYRENDFKYPIRKI